MSRAGERRAVSQAAIARRAGVARTTVSLALRGGEGLSPETVGRVMAAAESLGYRPNNLVQAVRNGRSGLVGVMVPPHDSYWSDILHGIHDELVENGHVPLMLWPKHGRLSPDEAAELRQVHRLIDWRVDGAILWPWYAGLYRSHVAEFRKRDLPLVTIDSVLPASFHADAVLSDEMQGARHVAAHLTGLGHRRILHLAGPATEAWSRDRRDCFAAAVRGHRGVVLHQVEVPLTKPRLALIRATLRRYPKVTAVFAATDEIAAEVYQVAAGLGKRVPADLSVVGYGCVDFGDHLRPPLTTVRHCPYRMGRTAAGLLLKRLGGGVPGRAASQERLPVEFVPRASTATPQKR